MLIIVAAFAISAVGVVHYAHSEKTINYAGRGGAIAAVLALGVMFLRPNWGRRNYDRRMKLVPKTATPLEYQQRQTAAIVAWLTIDASDQADQNKALFFASMIGTIFWGFGDVIATYLRAWFPTLFN